MQEAKSDNKSRKRRGPKPIASEGEAYEVALNMLGRRDFSHKEMQQRLRRRGAEASQVENTIAKLENYKLIDDQRYAQRVYEAWLNKKVYGRLHLSAELAKHGLPNTLQQQILEQFTPELEEAHALAAAEQFIHKNKQKLENQDAGARQKLYGAAARFMAARGFVGSYAKLLFDKIKLDVDYLD